MVRNAADDRIEDKMLVLKMLASTLLLTRHAILKVKLCRACMVRKHKHV